MNARRPPLDLLVWTALCCGLIAWAPSPPGPPPPTEEEVAAMQRAADIAADGAKEWQAERGDLTLPWNEASGRMAIVIDDVGRELHIFEQLLSLRFRLTFSVLPGAVYAAGSQLRAGGDRRRYREIMLHLPMEPVAPTNMEEGAEAEEIFLLQTDDEATLRRKIDAALVRVPEAVAVNNHMGSRLTADRSAMDTVMDVLAERGLAFVDSRTTAETVAEKAAAAAGIVHGARRTSFLDHDPRPEAIEAALLEAAERSREQPVIAIAHPSLEVVEVLRTHLPRLHAQGVAVYPVSRILAGR